MICSNCGAALPANGLICKACGTPLSFEQLQMMRNMNTAQSNGARIVPIKSSDDSSEIGSLGSYENPKESKALGAVILLIVLGALIAFALFLYFLK